MLDPARLLKAAVEAATEAGALLRREFHRPGGPRAYRGHAPVDDEAEELIRARLQAALPDASYLGEELGITRRAEDLWWVVDPNDGTAAFLQGFRGSSVSIALLVGAEPVLGVVYAPCAPDDDGDLLSWARGEQLQRNGTRLVAPEWPQRLKSHHRVLVSQHADLRPGANLRCCSPARYLAVPSVAYRLALVAAGEGVACASPGRVRYLDVAGGHALLAGVGGALLDARGHPVRFDREQAAGCFGGAEEVCKQLAARPWGEVLHRPEPRAGLLFPVYLEPGSAVNDAGLVSRAQGCLLGQLAGDSLGGLVEFASPQSIQEHYPEGPRWLEDGGTWGIMAGQPTDDSEMAMSLARCLIEQGGYLPEAAFAAYRTWVDSRPFDLGATTAAALKLGRVNPESQANGALMRCSPLALASSGPEQWAGADAALTHPHPRCAQCSRAYLAGMRAALEGASAPEVADRAQQIAPELVEAARQGRPSSYTHLQGWVEIAFQNAFYQLLNAPDLEQGVVDTVRQGGDTDTNAAIAGALLGALHGREAVPVQWRRAVLSCRPHPDYPAAEVTRPPFLWPVDAMAVAETLLAMSLSKSFL